MSAYQIWIVEYESTNYCGAPYHCSVWASDEDEAEMRAEDWAEEYMYEQDSYELQEEGLDEEGPFASIRSAVPLIGSEYEQGYKDPVQRDNFYPQVGEGWPKI